MLKKAEDQLRAEQGGKQVDLEQEVRLPGWDCSGPKLKILNIRENIPFCDSVRAVYASS